ncbi:hypothetical protein E1A91_D03G076100v1 [Gossypium mustelinum]|uniref:Uncharacterized protein n=1 Tax=Gossypium mustelinum TaxID=34275 RepID=A0A5D2VK60_GOSMU|nr:hypothetical protein E1A91_D03G076100v1 [Gossypium mustelinum]
MLTPTEFPPPLPFLLLLHLSMCLIDSGFFFKACGFRDDNLGSTMMMYSRTVSSTCFEGERMVKQAGRKLLLVSHSNCS